MPDTVCRAPVFEPAGSVKSGQIAAACHIKTVRGLHAGWGGLVASFAEGMGHLCCVPFAWWKTDRFRTP